MITWENVPGSSRVYISRSGEPGNEAKECCSSLWGYPSHSPCNMVIKTRFPFWVRTGATKLPRALRAKLYMCTDVQIGIPLCDFLCACPYAWLECLCGWKVAACCKFDLIMTFVHTSFQRMHQFSVCCSASQLCELFDLISVYTLSDMISCRMKPHSIWWMLTVYWSCTRIGWKQCHL